MKNARQKEIMDIIRQYTVSNQDALQELLKKRGYPVTQATISRDIRELGLRKQSGDGQGSRYVSGSTGSSATYRQILSSSMLSAYTFPEKKATFCWVIFCTEFLFKENRS